ncbi:MAG: glutathione synthase [Gemmatimonadota bacterium]
MRIAFLVNDIATEHPLAATTVMIHAAARRGHTVYAIGIDDLTYFSDGRIGGVAHLVPAPERRDQKEMLKGLQEADAARTRITTADIDVLYLRYNPGEDGASKPWAHDAGIVFGRMAVLQGVIVLSHPFTVGFAVNKMYLEHFPRDIRPESVITRRLEEIQRFHEQQNGQIVLKPLEGYGGKDVYLLDEDASNLKQIVESIARYSYIIAQEYLPAATAGDTRLFLFNGKPLVVDGKYAAVRRVNDSEDFRSNMSAGARPERAEITPRMLEIADIVRPRLLADGIFDVGLDIVGDKLVEINAISSGGLNVAGKMEGVDFGSAVIQLIEKKVDYRHRYGMQVRNRALAVMD